MTGLLHNEDCTDIFYHAPFSPGQAGATIDRYVDVLAEAGVSTLFCNTNARRVNYRSDVWMSFWEGYDPDLPDSQPFFASLAPEQVPHWRKLIHNMFQTHREGVDYPARALARCRHHGISPWISLRMNDVHCAMENLAHPFHSEFFRDTRWHRQGHSGYFARALDYAHAEVRAHFMALIEETVTRYDPDGVELDFMREPYLFSVGQERAGSEILTRWLGDVRRVTDAAAVRRGRPMAVGVRVPSCPETALALGLDAPTWARERLVDLVVPAPRWATLQYDLPLHAWRERLGDRVTLAGGLELRYQPHGRGPAEMVRPEHAVAAAVSVLSGGGDAVYLFNYFQYSPWPDPREYTSLLRAFSSLDVLLKRPRRHCVTYRDVTTPGENYRPPLPAEGRELSFSLPLGPTPPAGSEARVVIELSGSHEGGVPPRVAVNGVPASPLEVRADKDGTSRFVTYVLPLRALPGRNDDIITIVSPHEGPITVVRVEVSLVPASTIPVGKER